MVAKILIVCTMTFTLGGCTWWNAAASGSLCPVGPFIGDPGASQRLTRAEKEYVVTLNEAGASICGWQPPR